MGANRRRFLAGLAAIAALLRIWPNRLEAAPKSAPAGPQEAGDFARALAEALGGRPWTESAEVILEVPPLAENGAIVPVTVTSRLPGTTRILLFAERNPGPLLAQFRFAAGTDGWVSLRVKLNETGPVLAIAEAGGRFHGAVQQVRVMQGGCG